MLQRDPANSAEQIRERCYSELYQLWGESKNSPAIRHSSGPMPAMLKAS